MKTPPELVNAAVDAAAGSQDDLPAISRAVSVAVRCRELGQLDAACEAVRRAPRLVPVLRALHAATLAEAGRLTEARSEVA